MVINQGNPITSYRTPTLTGPAMDPRPCAQFTIPAIIPYVCMLSLSYPLALDNTNMMVKNANEIKFISDYQKNISVTILTDASSW